MSRLMMQVATPSKPRNPLISSFLPSLKNHSSKLRRVSLRGALQPRCSLQLDTDHQTETKRRSGGYKAMHWDYDTIESLNSDEYKEERHLRRAASLIEHVKALLREEVDDVRRLELIDDLHWMGLTCHFEDEIDQILNSIYLDYYKTQQRDLYSTSLGFKVLRRHCLLVSQDVFDRFKNEKGVFEPSLGDDIKGVFQLYEASFLQIPGEDTMDQVREFTTSILRNKVDENKDDHDDDLLNDVRASLKLPSHWRLENLNTRSLMDAYSKRPDMNPIVLELAKLDTNIIQGQYQEELKETVRWWKNTGITQHLPFARNRIVECYSWSLGFVQPRHRRYERIVLTRVNALITTLDDVFDVYGTLEELQLFTDAVRRWDDIESIEQLPKYMQVCYLALYNFVNEMAYDAIKNKGFNSAPYLRKAWGDLIESYIVEANWFYSGHKPSLEEYLNNGWRSIGGVPIISNIYFWVTDPLTDEGAQTMQKYHDLVRSASMILRLADDLGTSVDEMKRGDVPKSVQCYMNEYNASEEEARVQLRSMVVEMWKRVNAEKMSADSPFSKEFIEAAANVGRMAQFMYQDEVDGFGMLHSKVHKLLRGMLFEHYK